MAKAPNKPKKSKTARPKKKAPSKPKTSAKRAGAASAASAKPKKESSRRAAAKAPAKRLKAAVRAAGGDPLQQLYATLRQNVQNGILNLFPGAFTSNSGPIANLLSYLCGAATTAIGGNLTINPPADGKLVVTGSTSSFLSGGVTGTLVFSVDTDGKSLALAMRLSANQPLSLNSIPWFSLQNASIAATVALASKSFGTISGDLSIAGSAPVALTATLPTDGSASTFEAVFDKDHQPTLNGLFQLVGGINFGAAVPPQLAGLGGLGIKLVSFDYDFGAKELESFNIEITMAAGQPWVVFNGLSLQDFDIVFQVMDPAGERLVSSIAGATINLNPGLIDVKVIYPDLTVTAALDSQSGAVPVTSFVSAFFSSTVANALPVTGNITTFDMNVALGTQTNSFSLQVQFDGTWSLPATTPIFTVSNLGFAIGGASSSVDGKNRTISGNITGTVGIAIKPKPLLVDISAAYDPDTKWTVTGKQKTPLKTSQILQAYLPNWNVSGLPDLQLSDFGFTAVTGGDTPYYEISGTVTAWDNSLPEPLQGAPFATLTGTFGNQLGSSTGVKIAGDDAPTKFPFGKVSAELNWRGIDLTFSFNYDPDVKSYQIVWSSFTGTLVKENNEWTATLTFASDTTLGGMVETVLSWATGYRFSLGAPWNLLDDISLNGFEITWNFTTGTVSFTIPIGPIDLVFCKISGFEVTYNSTATGSGSSVMVALKGNFPWVNQDKELLAAGNSSDKLTWDATKPETTPAPPGGGNKYIDLRLLALGQHVEVTGIDTSSVANAMDWLGKHLNPPEEGEPLPVNFAAENSWLVATDFGLLRLDDGKSYAVTLQVIFDDPVLYALRLALDGPPAKIFGGLDFQIMYRKISDTLGVYQAEITLPTAMRTIQAGVYTITLPVFAIEVYTNGDFQIDVGFPWNRDFSRSFTVQAIIYPGIPMLGAGGFYFGKLSSASTNKVPSTTLGTFNPVIVFGFGAEIGFGKSLSIGPLSAGFSLTVLAIIEGVLAKWNPYDSSNTGNSPPSQIDGHYYIMLQGTFGISGTLYGTVDFVIIKASVNVSIGVVAQITYESYHPITFSVIAWVDVSASVEINCGLFSFSISFHFSLHLNETFTIQIGSTDAPWGSGTQQLNHQQGFLAQPLAFRLRSLRDGEPTRFAAAATTFQPNWQNLLKGSGVSLNGYLQFALTAAGDQANGNPAAQLPCYVLTMLVDGPPPPTTPPVADPGSSSFDQLCVLVAQWLVAALPNQVSTNTVPATPAQVNSNIVTDANLQDLLTYLSDSQNPQPILTSDVETMLGQQVKMTLYGPNDTASQTKIQAAFFPVPIELQLDIPAYGTFAGYSYSFGNFNQVSSNFISNLRIYFNQLAVQVQQEDDANKLRVAAALSGAPPSVANLVFADYFVLVARQMVQAMSDGLRDFKYQLTGNQTPQNVVDWVNSTGKLGSGGVVAFTLGDLFAMNENQPLRTGGAIAVGGSINGQPFGATYVVQAGDTLQSIAATTRFGGAFGAADIATANLTNERLLQQALTVTLGSAPPYTTQGGDSIATLVAKLNASSVANLVNGATVQIANTQVPFATAPGLLMTFAKAALPAFSYTIGGNDTLRSIMNANSLTAEQLAAGTNNGTIQNLWDASVVTLDILHLPQFQVGALLDEVRRCGTLQHISGMISRYHLHGLRVPTKGITPNRAGMWVTGSSGSYQLPAAAGLYALTGQQFPIPSLSSKPFTINVSQGPGWVTYQNGTGKIAFSVAPGSTDAAMIGSVSSFIGSRVVTGYTALGAESMVSAAPAVFSLGAVINLMSPAALSLPFGPAPQGPRTTRLWQFSSTFENQLDHYTRVNPSFQLQTQTYDDVTKTTVNADVSSYGYATVVEFIIKKVPQAAGATTAAGADTYEIVGASADAIVLLENIVSQFGRSDSKFANLLIAFPPDPALRTSGIAVDDQSTVTFGIAQVNLSTVTHPSGVGALFRLESAPKGLGVLNGISSFIRLLWEASITAQGGYYLYYTNGKDGLPDSAFNDKGQATLSLVVIYANLGDVAGADPIYDTMNAVAIADPIDTSQSVVVMVAAPQQTTVVFQQSDTLAAVAYRNFADIADIAQDNAGVPLANSAQLALSSGTYWVSPLGTAPGGAIGAIANHFGIANQQTIIDANPGIPAGSWPNLPAGTAIRLPTLTLTVNTSPGGNTLGALASYYGADVVGLAADNANVAGLFAGQTLTIRGGPVARSSTAPIATQTIQLTRPTPPAIPAPTDAGYGKALILNNFSLLGYQVEHNQDFGGSNLGVPVGPTNPAGPAPSRPGKIRRVMPMALLSDWNYKVAVAYTGAIPNVGVNASPYLGNGRLLQLDFLWLDLYGNTIISDLSNPQAGDLAPLNGSPILLGYTDPLLSVGQWPSVTTDWQVLKENGTPKLVVDLSFDPSRYLPSSKDPQPKPGEDPIWQKNAKLDLPTYQRLVAQLSDPNPIGFSIATSLLTAPVTVGSSDVSSIVQWANAICAFVAARAQGNSGTQPSDLAKSIKSTIDWTAVNPAQTFELTLDLSIVRTTGVVEGEFATLPGVRAAATRVAPLTGGGSLDLSGFAANFEQALTQASAMLKVAVGIDRMSGGAAAQGKAIWAVRVGLSAAQPISYAITDVGNPYIYAPAPISTNLESRQHVPIYDYAPGSGNAIDFNTVSYYLDFANIDIDQWVQTIFTAVDDVLTPQFTSSIMVLEKAAQKQYLATLLGKKSNLAKVYSTQMRPVFQDQESAPLTDVQEAFRQQLLERLGNAYTTQAALQYEASVAAAVGETPPPNLFGSVVPSAGSSVPSGITFTAAKFPLQQADASAPASVVSLVTTPTVSGTSAVASESSFPVTLAFTTGAIEHQIAAVPGITGYLASSWLSFLLPSSKPAQPGSLAADLGSTVIPMVLRAYPSNPSLRYQLGAETYPKTTDLTELTQWSYSLAYALDFHYPQDTVHCVIEFNIKPLAMSFAGLVDAFAAMAEFMTVYPRVQQDLVEKLATITPATTDPTTLKVAGAAIESFNGMLDKIAPDHHPNALAIARKPKRFGGTAPGGPLELAISEAAQDIKVGSGATVSGALVVTITVEKPGPSGVADQPKIYVGPDTTTYTLQQLSSAAGTFQYYYVDNKKNVLLFKDAQPIPQRILVLDGMQILDLQDAQASAYVVRNANLVKGRPTSKIFVYQTPPVTFGSPCQPVIESNQPVDIASLGLTLKKGQKPPKRALADQLTALFTTLTGDATYNEMIVQVEVQDTYPITGTALPISIPVLMQPPTPVTIREAKDGVTPISAMIVDLAAAIKAWFAAEQPNMTGNGLVFKVTIMSSLTLQPMPMLQLTNLDLSLAFVSDIPPPPSTDRATRRRRS